MGWELDDETAERFDPPTAGWELFHGVYGEKFPELQVRLDGKVEHRRMVFQRDFWVRGDERLIVEWAHPWRTVHAVLLNGQEYTGPMTAEEFNRLWERTP